MKALTLWQPWATLIAAGLKTIETRHWSTGHRGLIAIHAAVRPMTMGEAAMMAGELLRRGWSTEDNHALAVEASRTRGHVVATAWLADVVPTDKFTDRHPDWPWGDFTPGRYAWLLHDVKRLDPPVPATGRQGLWTWDHQEATR